MGNVCLLPAILLNGIPACIPGIRDCIILFFFCCLGKGKTSFLCIISKMVQVLKA